MYTCEYVCAHKTFCYKEAVLVNNTGMKRSDCTCILTMRGDCATEIISIFLKKSARTLYYDI